MRAATLLLGMLLALVPIGVLRAEDPPPEKAGAAEGSELRERIKSLNRRSIASLQRGKFAEGIDLAREALTLLEQAVGREDANVAVCRHNLAILLLKTGQYQEARLHFQRALQIYENHLDPGHLELAPTVYGLAEALDAMGHHEEALAGFQRVLRIRERALGRDHPEVGDSLCRIAEALREQGRFDAAEDALLRARDLLEKALGPEHESVAGVMHAHAGLLQELGKYEAARPLYERALHIIEKARNSRPSDLAACLNNLAVLYDRMGAYESSRPLYERSLRVVQSALGPEHPDVATCLCNLAFLLQNQSQYDAALTLYERALEIRMEALGPAHRAVGQSLHNIAYLFGQQGEYERAAPLLQRAIAIMEKTLGPTHPDLMHSLGNYAFILMERGLFLEARTLFERVLAVEERTLGAEHPGYAGSLANLAYVFNRQGMHETALPLYRQAKTIYDDVLGPRHPKALEHSGNLADLLYTMGRHEAAVTLFEQCLDGVEENAHRHFGGLQSSERFRLAASVRVWLAGWFRVGGEARQSGYADLLRFKGVVARATAAERRLARQGGSAAVARIHDLRAAERRLSRLANTMPPRLSKERHAAWTKAYANAAAARERMALDLARDFAPLRASMERRQLGVADVRRQLASDEVLVDVLRSDGRYLAWVVRRDGPVARIDLGDAARLEEAASQLTTLTADVETVPTEEAWNEALERLSKLVVHPLRAHLDPSVRTLCLCPDAALAALPFAALPGREPGRCLIDDYLLVNLPTAQDLIPWSEATDAGQGAVLVGAVDFGQAENAPPSVPIELPSAALATGNRSTRGRRLNPLPATRDEVEFVARRVGDDVTMLLGSQATEARFRAAVRGRRLLHLATHGFVRDDLMRGLPQRGSETREWLGASAERQFAVGHDPLLLAGLAFAGANGRDGAHGDDGILTALEASHLDLDGVDLVVLSACQTALGKAESGEGVVGLVHGFRMAGAKRVIASLWQVDDEATRLLMQHLYDGMLREKDPLSPAQALREAMQRVRNSSGEDGRSFAAPRYWAGFACFGR